MVFKCLKQFTDKREIARKKKGVRDLTPSGHGLGKKPSNFRVLKIRQKTKQIVGPPLTFTLDTSTRHSWTLVKFGYLVNYLGKFGNLKYQILAMEKCPTKALIQKIYLKLDNIDYVRLVKRMVGLYK